jgi:hypothetical protein
MRLKAIASPERHAQELAMALNPAPEESTDPLVPAAVPSSTRLDCGAGFFVRRWKAPMSWKTGRPPGLSHVRAALGSGSGWRASLDDPLRRTPLMASADDVAAVRRPRQRRLLTDEPELLLAAVRLKRALEPARRLLDVDERAGVWGERGGNEIPLGGSYAGLR